MAAVFRCKRCGLVAPLRAEPPPELLALFPCPQCGRRASLAGLALRSAIAALVVASPTTVFAYFFVLYGTSAYRTACGHARGVDEAPLVFAAGAMAIALVATVTLRWTRTLAKASRLELLRFWEWRLPDGPRVIAVQDPDSGDDAVWIDGVRAADEHGTYAIPLRDDAASPYRAERPRVTLRFPAEGTCWLTIGAKRIEPHRTSADVF